MQIWVGTRVTLHMKDEAHSMLEMADLEANIKKYSQFMMFPIMLKVEKKSDGEDDLDDDDDTPKEKFE